MATAESVTCYYAIHRYLKRFGSDDNSTLFEMLRARFISLSTTRHSVRISRPVVILGTRLNSFQTPEQKRALNKEKKELQKDWIAPILAYEEVKHKSQQPSEVRASLSTFTSWILKLGKELVFNRCTGTRRGIAGNDSLGS